jgi:hypothetical protein
VSSLLLTKNLYSLKWKMLDVTETCLPNRWLAMDYLFVAAERAHGTDD